MSQKDKLIEYLPTIFQQASLDTNKEEKSFIEDFLQLFQQQIDKLESKVDRIPNMFEPWRADADFLPWLASWLDLELPESWGERTKRELIDNIFTVYRKRGTLDGISTILKIYLGSAVKEIKDDPDEAHRFIVTVNFPRFEPAELARRTRDIKQVIDKEKPAHTDFIWNVLSPTMQINFHSTIGVDTILGTTPNPDFNANKIIRRQ